MTSLLEPKETIFKTQAGDDRMYILSKFPAIAGREIVTQYPMSAIPKLGDYTVNEALMLKIMNFVAVPTDNGPLRLSTAALIDNHIPDAETLIKIELHMMEYNTSFFWAGILSTFLKNVEGKATALITKMWTDLLARFLPTDAPPSKNCEPSTH